MKCGRRSPALRPLDDAAQEWPNPRPHRLRALTPLLPRRENVLQAAIDRVEGKRLLEETGEAGPGVVIGGSILRRVDGLREGVLEHGVNQLSLVGK